MPDVTVPVATYTGWNPRAPETGGAGQIVSMQGSTLPFPATRAEREQRGDPRPSIEERYRDRDDYWRGCAPPPRSWSRQRLHPGGRRRPRRRARRRALRRLRQHPGPPSAANSSPSPSGTESMRRSAGACPPPVTPGTGGGQAPALRIYEAAGEGSSPAAGREAFPAQARRPRRCTCPREAASQPGLD